MAIPQIRRAYALPHQSFFLFGIRGVGKSTWARDRLGEAHRFDFLDEALYQSLLADPGQFAGELRRLEAGSWVVVDEVQRLPQLLNEVHRFIEERRLHFALLGSSARKLRQSGVNLLAGRALWKEMFPLVPAEVGAAFDLARVLRFGSLPLVLASEHPRETLEAYGHLYLRDEIKAEALVRNLPGFARFLPVAALLHGQAVNVSALARDAGVARTTVEGYLDILEDTLMVRRLPAFESKLRVRERRHPKLYWVDPGVVRALKRQLGPPTVEELGPLLEGWVFTLLRYYAAERGLCEEIFYWAAHRARSAEVDFVLRRGRKLLALEVKAASRPKPDLLAGLRAAGVLDGLERRILVYRGERAMRSEDGIEIWPVAHFLAALEVGTLWS